MEAVEKILRIVEGGGLSRSAFLLNYRDPVFADQCIDGVIRGLHVRRYHDYLLVSPEGSSSEILISQVRGVREFLSIPSFGEYRVVVIKSLNNLSARAIGCLLKIIEEPPVPSVFMIMVGAQCRIPGTISSRCFSVSVGGADSPADVGDMIRCYERFLYICAGHIESGAVLDDIKDIAIIERAVLYIALRVCCPQSRIESWFDCERDLLEEVRARYSMEVLLDRVSGVVSFIRNASSFSAYYVQCAVEHMIIDGVDAV